MNDLDLGNDFYWFDGDEIKFRGRKKEEGTEFGLRSQD